VIDGRRVASSCAPGVGRVSAHAGDAVVLATALLERVLLSTNAKGCNVRRSGARTNARHVGDPASPRSTDVHPADRPHQSKLTLMSESLRNDGRIWSPRKKRHPSAQPDSGRGARLLSRAAVPSYGNSRRALASRRARRCATRGAAWPGGTACSWTSATPLRAWPSGDHGTLRQPVRDVQRITGETRSRCRCGSTPPPLHHGAVGGLNLMTTIDGLYAIGEANFSDTAPTGWARARSCRGSPTATSSCVHHR